VIDLLDQHHIFLQNATVFLVEVLGVVSELLVETLDLVFSEFAAHFIALHEVQAARILLGLLEHPDFVQFDDSLLQFFVIFLAILDV
jgi:hypothetical protein